MEMMNKMTISSLIETQKRLKANQTYKKWIHLMRTSFRLGNKWQLPQILFINRVSSKITT
jgi:hypothetical protein